MTIRVYGGAFLPLTGGTLTGSLTLGNSGLLTTSGAGVIGAGFGLDQNVLGDIVSKSTGRIGFVPSTNIGAAPDAWLTRTAAGVLKVNNYIGTVPTTVASLPAAATAGQGATGMVTDANAITFQSIVAGGGTNVVPVYSDGTNWRIG